jgi:hypothetical protein
MRLILSKQGKKAKNLYSRSSPESHKTLLQQAAVYTQLNTLLSWTAKEIASFGFDHLRSLIRGQAGQQFCFLLALSHQEFAQKREKETS